MITKFKLHIARNLEAIIWIVALVLLAFTNPYEQHFTLCPLSNLGISFCPGCGLGHSIAFIFRGEWLASFDAHPLGGFALIVLIYRIVQLLYKNQKIKLNINQHG